MIVNNATFNREICSFILTWNVIMTSMLILTAITQQASQTDSDGDINNDDTLNTYGTSNGDYNIDLLNRISNGQIFICMIWKNVKITININTIMTIGYVNSNNNIVAIIIISVLCHYMITRIIIFISWKRLWMNLIIICWHRILSCAWNVHGIHSCLYMD